MGVNRVASVTECTEAQWNAINMERCRTEVGSSGCGGMQRLASSMNLAVDVGGIQHKMVSVAFQHTQNIILYNAYVDVNHIDFWQKDKS